MDDNIIQEFKIGQKVLIIGAGNEQDDFERDICFLRPEMSRLVGNVATISDKRNAWKYDGRYVYSLEEFHYSWADKWLAPLYKTSDFIYS